MRQSIKIPRILKINWIKALSISVVFNNGESRIIDFRKVLKKIGQLIREARLKSGLTQQDLALKSGTSRTYVSRIENDRSDLEVATLRKIIETGLGRKLDISIK